MALLQRACSWIVRKANIDTPLPSSETTLQVGTGYTPKTNTNALIARHTSWAYSAVNLNSNSVSMAPWRLYTVKPSSTSKSRFPTKPISKRQRANIMSKDALGRRCEGQEVEEVLCHPVIDLLVNVNPTMNQFGLRNLTEQSVSITGNGFWWKYRDGMGVVEQLWFLYPQFMHAVKSEDGNIVGFKYGNSDKSIFIPIEDIVFFRKVDLSSPVLGVGEMQKALVSVDLSNAMSDHSLNLVTKGGTPETVLNIPAEQVVSEKEIKRMKRDYRQKYRGTHNAGKMLVMTGGATIEKLSFSHKELEMLGSRKWTRDEIFTVFGVPTTFCDVSAVSRANADAANVEYQKRTVKPKLIMFEDTVNEQLVQEYDESLFIAFDENVPADKEFRLKERASNIAIGYSTVNEERVRDGLDPIDGGDEPRETSPPPEKKVKRVPPLTMPAANFIPEKFVDAVQKYLKRFGRHILEQAKESDFKHVKVANADDVVSKWFDFTIWDKEAENAILPFVRASILLAGPKAIDSVNPSRQFDDSSPSVIKLLEARKTAIRGINRTIQKDTRNALAIGIESGENLHDLRKRVGRVFGFDDKNRALRIARTETIWAMNAGAVEGYKQSGVVTGLEWSTAEDERVCEWCGPMDGKVVSIDDVFWKQGEVMVGRDGGRLPFDYDNIGHPPLHPQCRCTVVPVTKEI